MYIITRLLIAAVIFAVLLIIIIKSSCKHKLKYCVLSFVITAVFSSVLYMLPFENLFLTFKTPESAYLYISNGELDYKIEGASTAYVVIKNNKNNNECAIIPGNNESWKLDTGINTKIVKSELFKSGIVQIFRYKNTNEYYVEILIYNDNKALISDNLNSQFTCCKENNNQTTNEYTYVAYIPDFSDNYELIINNEPINFSK